MAVSKWSNNRSDHFKTLIGFKMAWPFRNSLNRGNKAVFCNIEWIVKEQTGFEKDRFKNFFGCRAFEKWTSYWNYKDYKKYISNYIVVQMKNPTTAESIYF